MMIKEAGCYRGAVQEHAVSMSSSGIPQFEAKLQAVERYDFGSSEWLSLEGRDDVEITCYLVFFTKEGKPTFHIDAVKQVFEWDGLSLAALDGADLAGSALQWNVEENEYQGKIRMKVTRIADYDDVPGTGTVKKLDAAKVAEMDSKFAAALKKLSGGPKPVSAPAKAPAKPAALPPKTKKGAKKEAAAGPTESTASPTVADTAPKTEPLAKKSPPKPPSLKPAAAPAVELTYEEAWGKCYEVKGENVTDDQLAAAFTHAIERICPDKAEDEITGADWGVIADTVIAEYGVFV